MTNGSKVFESDDSIPIHQIDLSMPPRSRYVALARMYASEIERLTILFDSLLEDVGIPPYQHVWIKRAARLLLRRVHSREETEELQGISKATGVSMYLLVSFNVLLDLLMGCTSGAVRSAEPSQLQSQAKMLHFRTLDWGMDPLRSVIVQLEFIRSKSSTPRAVLASSITYVGFVGVLTGVRKDLSMSLNFRGVHNATTRAGHFQFYLHQLLVLLGMRRAISSLLRSHLLGHLGGRDVHPSTLATLAHEIPPKPSTAAYLIFSDGKTTVTMEKDYRTALLRQSKSFIVMTNHDLDLPESTGSCSSSTKPELASMEDILSESVHRRDCIADKWKSKVRKAERRMRRQGILPGTEIKSTQARTELCASKQASTTTHSRGVEPEARRDSIDMKAELNMAEIEDSVTITSNEVISWVSAWPTTNECTHFAAVLDPTTGEVVWTKRYLTPIDEA
jgi:hypothetical protein